jgi:hypothetical protein
MKNILDVILIVKKALNELEIEEKKKAISLSDLTLHQNINDKIECVGCSIQINNFIKNLVNLSCSKNQQINLEGIVVHPSRKIGINIRHIINRYIMINFDA